MESWFYTIEAWLAQIPEPLGTLVNYTLVFVFLSFLFVLPLVTFTVLIERKVIGFMQHRFGPNRVGPRWGIFLTPCVGAGRLNASTSMETPR